MSPEQPVAYRAAKRGTLAAENLTTADRGRLLWRMHASGMTVAEIGRKTRTTDYTVGRILDREGYAQCLAAAEAVQGEVAKSDPWRGVA